MLPQSLVTHLWWCHDVTLVTPVWQELPNINKYLILILIWLLWWGILLLLPILLVLLLLTIATGFSAFMLLSILGSRRITFIQLLLLHNLYFFILETKFCEKCNFPLVAPGYKWEQGNKLYLGQKMSQRPERRKDWEWHFNTDYCYITLDFIFCLYIEPGTLVALIPVCVVLDAGHLFDHLVTVVQTAIVHNRHNDNKDNEWARVKI